MKVTRSRKPCIFCQKATPKYPHILCRYAACPSPRTEERICSDCIKDCIIDDIIHAVIDGEERPDDFIECPFCNRTGFRIMVQKKQELSTAQFVNIPDVIATAKIMKRHLRYVTRQNKEDRKRFKKTLFQHILLPLVAIIALHTPANPEE